MTLFVCDRPEHGYGCYHLEEDLSGLTKQEQDEWKSFDKEWGFDYEALAEVDEALVVAREDYDRAIEEANEAEEETQALLDFKRLLEKKLR